MKRITITAALAICIALITKGQNIDDALRYSQTFNTGSARFMSMGGAFTALGADLSAISLNPAGAGMFRSFEFSVTPQLTYNNNSAVFNGATTSDFLYSFGIGQAGVVASIFSSGNSTGLLNLNAAYSFNKTNHFGENKSISGISSNTSMADYWAINSEGIRYNNLTGAAGLAYDVWLIDTLDGYQDAYGTIFSAYGTNANSVYGQTIRRVIENKGSMGEHSFTVAGNYSNKVFFGATLSITSLRYTGHYEHLENDVDNEIDDFKNFVYTDHLDAKGTGYALKIGAVFRPVEMLRVGLSFHSPTLFRINEYFYDDITSRFDTPDSQGKTSYEAANDPYRYSYTLTTPLRLNAGVAIQLKKLAVITADYELVDYRMARFSNASDDYNYFDENESVKNVLKSTSNLRFGAEFRLSSLYLRGGYGLYGSAFDKDEINEGLNYNQVSFGVGFRQQNVFFDLGFSSLTSSSKYFMYIDEPYLSPATFTTSKSTFAATLGFKF